MKYRFFTIIVFIFQSWMIMAQEEQVSDEDSSGISIFLSAGFDYGTAYHHTAYTLDINGGFDYQNIYFGGFGCSIINDIEVNQDSLYQNMQMDFGYGGFILGYNFFTQKKVHFFTGTQFGWGVVSLSQKKISNKIEYMERIYYDNVFLLKPTIMAEFALSEHFSINTGINYLYMTGLTTLSGFSNDDFNGINYSFSLKYHL